MGFLVHGFPLLRLDFTGVRIEKSTAKLYFSVSVEVDTALGNGRPTGTINVQVGVHDRRNCLRDFHKENVSYFRKKKSKN